ncbi:MAG TPA: sulfur carrier protein ThiS [Anaerovoracaceae bacterium]|nr:sulfur carrier protein ThiS [Anaerovoracaceae bacterium]
MILTVTGNQKEYAEGLTVAKLIELEQVEMPLYVTVSVNDEFIPGDTFETAELYEGDNIEFFYFMGGGN